MGGSKKKKKGKKKKAQKLAEALRRSDANAALFEGPGGAHAWCADRIAWL